MLADLRFTGPLGKFTWRMLATVLGSQAIVIGLATLVARGQAAADRAGTDGRNLVVGLALAGLCLLGAALMRGRVGVTVGWLVQLLSLLSGFVVGTMFIVGLIFLALWVGSMVSGQRVDRVDAERAAEAGLAAG